MEHRRSAVIAAIALLAAASAQAQAAPEGPLVAYIAEPLDWTDHWGECADQACGGEPESREVRFRLLETVRGPAHGGEITVVLDNDADREATHTRRTLLVGRWTIDDAFLPLVAHQVDPLRGGGWGLCEGNRYMWDDDADALVQSLEFASVFGDASRLNALGRRQRFDPEDFRVDGNAVRCIRGVRAEHVVRFYAGEPVDMPPALPEPEPVETHVDRRREARHTAKKGEFRIVTASPWGDTLWAFVGEQLAFQDMEAQCGAGCWQFDENYSARYRPRAVFDGVDMGIAPVRFLVQSHMGVPPFAETPAALLFVWAHRDGAVLAKYQGISVDRTLDGRWAICGDPYARGDSPPALEARGLMPLRFPDEVVFDDVSRWTPRHIAEIYPADTYSVVDGKVRCVRGVDAEGFADFLGAQIRDE